MSTSEQQPADPYAEPLASYGKAVIMVPLIIGGAIVVAVIILWHAHMQKLRASVMAGIEVEAREELREAYMEMRALKPNVALVKAENASRLVSSLDTRLAPDYAQLKVALLLLEGESYFMKDCARYADTAEDRFDKALGFMTYASGDMWQFGMLGRARARFELRKFDEALSDLDSVLDRNSSFGSGYYWRALTREQLGDAEGAKADEARARALDSWPPLRDFMQASCVWTRDILSKQKFCGPGEMESAGRLTPFFMPPVDEDVIGDSTPDAP